MRGVGLGASGGVEVGRVVGVEPTDHEVQRLVVAVGLQLRQALAEPVDERGTHALAQLGWLGGVEHPADVEFRLRPGGAGFVCCCFLTGGVDLALAASSSSSAAAAIPRVAISE